MDASLRKLVLSILEQHRILTLATLRPDGWPQATTVGYVSDELKLYFMCGRDSQKAHNLMRDDRVSLAIDNDVPDPSDIQGLSMAARATPVADGALMRRILFELLPKKYPEYVQAMQSVDLSEVAVFVLRPVVISVLNYRKGFGHADLVVLDPTEE